MRRRKWLWGGSAQSCEGRRNFGPDKAWWQVATYDCGRRPNQKWSRKGCKPSSVCIRLSPDGENHLSQQPIPGTLLLSQNDTGRVWVPYLVLLPMRFSVPRNLRCGRWALTPPFHPYPSPLLETGGLFSVALSVTPDFHPEFPCVSPACRPGLHGIAPCGVRTFLPRLSPGAILHPSETGATIRRIAGVASIPASPSPGGRKRNHSGRCKVPPDSKTAFLQPEPGEQKHPQQ